MSFRLQNQLFYGMVAAQELDCLIIKIKELGILWTAVTSNALKTKLGAGLSTFTFLTEQIKAIVSYFQQDVPLTHTILDNIKCINLTLKIGKNI